MAESIDAGLSYKSRPAVGQEVEELEGLPVVPQIRVDNDKTAAEEELQSLEYEEDCFYTVAGSNPTPSFDEVSEGSLWYAVHWVIYLVSVAKYLFASSNWLTSLK